MGIEKTIQNCLNFLIDSNKEAKEWDDEGFLDRSDVTLIRTLSKRHPNQWTAKMSFTGWEILSKYQEELKDCDVDFNTIEKPDYISEDKITDNDHNIVNIVEGKFKILNPCEEMKRAFNSNKKEILVEFNLQSLYDIFPFIQNNKIRIDKQYFKFINMYLNRLDVNDMFIGFKGNMDNFNFQLKPFQAIGCLYMLLNKRMILGDEMGLGKTIQALASVELSNQKPCLIVCPNSLKLNWKKEISNCFKNQNIEILNKKSKKDADFYIINYESLHNYLDLIQEIKPKSAILDESHYVKNQKTKRTTSCQKAIKNIEYRFALTGTAILKSPVDLISQLKIINQLDYFGCENTFIEKFCGNSNTQWGKDIRKGASNITVLNKELRESCFIRRIKEQVTKDLPDKSRSYIYLNSSTKEYKKEFKIFNELPRKEKIHKLEHLRQLAAEEKIEDVKEWINNFQETERKLVVFAYHKDIQDKLISAYPNAAKIISGMSDDERQQNIDLFMEDENCKIIICSLKAASVGLTLTAASDVLFAEMDWCAANNTQAEDRCHRIGQKNNVNIWYLVAKNTIEEQILKVVSNKLSLYEKLYNSNIDEVLETEKKNFKASSLYEEILADLEKVS